MTLKTLFSRRRTGYMKEIMKYGRLIFNDHFVLLIFLLIGAGGLAYSNYLDTLTTGMIQPRLFVGLVFFILASTGSITLLLEPADQIFLLPKEEAFKPIFKQLVTRSFLESLLPLGLVTFITFPVFAATTTVAPLNMALIFMALASLKSLTTLVRLSPFFEMEAQDTAKIKLTLFILKLATLFGLLFVHIPVTAILILLTAAFFWLQFYQEKIYLNRLFNWEQMIRAEEQRMQKLYRFIGMFASVPNMQTPIKRLAWLDSLLNYLTKQNPTASYYYILRLAIRNTEYSLMILRAALVAAIILAFTNNLILSALIVVLFLYMIGFQLLTLVNELKSAPLFQIYPISADEKVKAVQKLIFQCLFFVSILLGLASLNGLGIIGLTLIVLGILFGLFFGYLYAPRRIKAGN